MTQKDTPSKMGFCQHKNREDGAAGEGREGDMRRSSLSQQQNHILSDTWKIEFIPMKGLKRHGVVRLGCKKCNIGRKKATGGITTAFAD